MHRFLNTSIMILLIIACPLLASCISSSSTEDDTCHEGICVDLQLSEPICFNRPMTATLVVKTNRDIAGLELALGDQDAYIHDEGMRVWHVDVQANQLITRSTVLFVHKDYFTVEGLVTLPGGRVSVGRSKGTIPNSCAK